MAPPVSMPTWLCRAFRRTSFAFLAVAMMLVAAAAMVSQWALVGVFTVSMFFFALNHHRVIHVTRTLERRNERKRIRGMLRDGHSPNTS